MRRRWREDGTFGALRLSDVVTRREFRQSRYYVDYFVPWGVEYELKARLPSPLWHVQTFVLHRGGIRDFTPRDRLVLDLLTPTLQPSPGGGEDAPTAGGSSVRARSGGRGGPAWADLPLGPGGEIEFMSPPARRLVRDFFPAAPFGRLPSALVNWLEGGGSVAPRPSPWRPPARRRANCRFADPRRASRGGFR